MISVTVLTKNSQDTLKNTLESLKSFSEVIVLDTGSSDDTLAIAKTFPNVKIHTSNFLGFGPLHNLASSLTAHDWVLSIDSDEVLTKELIDEIQQLKLDPSCVYVMFRHNFFNGKHIRWCGGWHPDSVARLYHKSRSRFLDVPVHEKIITEGLKTVYLKNPLLHYPYREIGDFLSKMQTYTTLFAKQHQHEKKGSLCKAIFHSWYAFFKSYIFKKGFLGGKEGFIISAYNGHTAFYKYLKLEESQK